MTFDVELAVVMFCCYLTLYKVPQVCSDSQLVSAYIVLKKCIYGPSATTWQPTCIDFKSRSRPIYELSSKLIAIFFSKALRYSECSLDLLHFSYSVNLVVYCMFLISCT